MALGAQPIKENYMSITGQEAQPDPNSTEPHPVEAAPVAVQFDDEGRDVHGFRVDLRYDEKGHPRSNTEVELAALEREVWMCQRKIDLIKQYGSAAGHGDLEGMQQQLANATAAFKAAGGELPARRQTRAKK